MHTVTQWPLDGFTASARFRVIAHIAGLDSPDGTHRGVFRVLKHDAEVAAERCAAPTR